MGLIEIFPVLEFDTLRYVKLNPIRERIFEEHQVRGTAPELWN